MAKGEAGVLEVKSDAQKSIEGILTSNPFNEYHTVPVEMNGDSSDHSRSHLISLGKTALDYADKKDGAIIHYRKRRYFLINGYNDHQGIEEFAMGKSDYRGLEGTWKDAEDGQLSGHAIEQGSVDSTIARAWRLLE